MRITGGTLRGRSLLSPATDLIRPTADKIRQAVFNAILSRYDITDAIVIDACAGTGALGFEALSHGAGDIIFLDKNPSSLALAKQNAVSLNVLERCHFIKADCLALPVRPASLPVTNLCLLDPPYRQDILMPALLGLKSQNWIDDDTIIVAESEAEYLLPLPLLFDRVYGETRIMMLTGDAIKN